VNAKTDIRGGVPAEPAQARPAARRLRSITDLIEAFDEAGFGFMLLEGGGLAIRDLEGEVGQWPPRAIPAPLLRLFGAHADALGRWIENGGVI
jgi:hypothetical protein